MTGEIMWRAEFFDNKDDEVPVRMIYIHAVTEDEAAQRASAQMGGSMRADLVRTILAKSPPN